MKKDHIEVLLEQVVSQNQAILEGINGLPTRVEFNELRQDVVDLKRDVEFDRSAAVRTDREVDDIKRRVSRLEAV